MCWLVFTDRWIFRAEERGWMGFAYTHKSVLEGQDRMKVHRFGNRYVINDVAFWLLKCVWMILLRVSLLVIEIESYLSRRR